MPESITNFLASWLSDGSVRHIGQVALWRTEDDRYRLCHEAELGSFGQAATAALPTHGLPVDARHLAKLDAGGQFRPLKSAPTLAGGWLLELADIAAVREALDYFYPAAVALWLRAQQGRLPVTHLRETLNRQTGMYRVTGLITDAEAATLVRDACAPDKCTRRILWDISPELPLHAVREKRLESAAEAAATPQRIPVLCCEACNLLVAAARSVVKQRMQREAEAS